MIREESARKDWEYRFDEKNTFIYCGEGRAYVYTSEGLSLAPNYHEVENFFENVDHRWWQRSGTETSFENISNYQVRVYGTQETDTSNGTYYYPVFDAEGGNTYFLQAKAILKTKENTGDSSSIRMGFRTGDNGDNMGLSNGYYFKDMEENRVYNLWAIGLLPEGETQITMRGTLAYDLSPGEEIDLHVFDMMLNKVFFKQNGYRVSPPLPLSGVGILESSMIEWDYSKQNIDVKCAVNEDGTNEPGESSYVSADSGGSIPVLDEGEYLKGKYLWVKQELSTDNNKETPKLHSLSVNLTGEERVDCWVKKNGEWQPITGLEVIG